MSGGLKTLYWTLFSVALHLLAWGAVNLTPRSFTSKSEDVLDLTVLELPAGSPQPAAPVAARPKASSANTPKLSPSVNASSDNDSTPESQDTPSAAGLGGDAETVSWNEITRLPKVHKEVKAQYPEEAKKAGVDGPVHAELVIGRDGKVRHVHILQGPGHGLNESAINALRQFEFQPAFKGNESVAVKIRYTYRFKLDIN